MSGDQPAVIAVDISLDGVLATVEPAEQFENSGDGPPVISTLPMDDPEFREIVVGFVDRLHEEIEAIDAAWQSRDLNELSGLAHWLKGAAGTVGFREFTEPGIALMEAAREQNTESIEGRIREIRNLTSRIQIPVGSAT